jgi:hypothetical protein
VNASPNVSIGIFVLPLLASLLVSSVIGIVMIIGALKMMRLESHGWGMTASILALLPCSPIGLLGMVAGIWSLIVLNRRNVKEAFEARRAGRLPPEPSGTIARRTQLSRPRVMLVVALLLIPILLLGYWFVAAWNHQGTLNIQAESGVDNAQILVQREGQQVTIIDTRSRPWANLDPGLYQLVLVSGSGHTSGQIEISPSSLAVSGGRQYTVRVYVRKIVDTRVEKKAESPLDRKGWTLGPAGPRLSSNGIAWLRLPPEKVEKVNQILKASYQDFLTLEAKHTERRTDESGHLLIVVKPFPAEVAKLEDQLWLKLDGVFDTEQQSVARLNLKLDPAEVLQPGMTLRDAVAPGFFGWGKGGGRLELWKVGTWFHWKVSARGNEDVGSAPQLPEDYRRYWQEPEGKEAKTTER